MLPQAFIFSYAGQQGGRTRMDFKPNPHFHARTHEAEVFHAMEGSLWVDAKQNRLAEISGRLMHPVKFAGGLLGHLDSGGTFVVKQEPVAPGYWELTLLNVHMKGKALFFKTISVQQDFSRSDFKKVLDDLTLAKAADALTSRNLPPAADPIFTFWDRSNPRVHGFIQRFVPEFDEIWWTLVGIEPTTLPCHFSVLTYMQDLQGPGRS